MSAVLEVSSITVRYDDPGGQPITAVDGVSFDLQAGEILGIVGESGCGKSSLARALMLLPRPSEGEVRFEGRDISGLGRRELRRFRPRMQMVFQDPTASLNPQRTVREIIADPLIVNGLRSEAAERIDDSLKLVGFSPAEIGHRRPHELSGGQCQRVAIARAIALRPTVLVCDEAVSALDVSVQGEVLNTILDLRERLGLSVIFISHDLGVVRAISDRVLVMYLGRICEIAASRQLFATPSHPYSRLLLGSDSAASVEPVAGGRRVSDDVPSAADPPSGCRFHPRCALRIETCDRVEPSLLRMSGGHWVSCHLYQDSEPLP